MRITFSAIAISAVVLIMVAMIIRYGLPSIKKDLPSVHSKRIALFAPAIHPAMDEINTGFEQTLQKMGGGPYLFDLYNANGKKTLLRAQAEEIVHQQYDLIFSIGTTCTHTLAQLTAKKHEDTPIVFTAVEDPVALGIVQSLQSSGNNLTGTTIQDDFDATFDALLRIKPNAAHILFVYDPSGTVKDDLIPAIKRAVTTRGIAFSTVEVFNATDIATRVPAHLAGIDVIFIYTDHTVVSGIDSLITLCNKHHITLFASDLNSAHRGAAVAFGVQEYEHGAQAARKAHMILMQQKKPLSIPITPVENRTLLINQHTIGQQGIFLDTQSLEQFNKTEGVIL